MPAKGVEDSLSVEPSTTSTKIVVRITSTTSAPTMERPTEDWASKPLQPRPVSNTPPSWQEILTKAKTTAATKPPMN